MNRPKTITGLGCGVILFAQATAIAVSLGLTNQDLPGDRSSWVAAIALAAVATGPGAIAGWLVARISRRLSPPMAAAGGLAATAFRLLPPLAALAWLSSSRTGLARAGGGGLLVAFYLTMLGVTVGLHMLERSEAGSAGGATSAN